MAGYFIVLVIHLTRYGLISPDMKRDCNLQTWPLNLWLAQAYTTTAAEEPPKSKVSECPQVTLVTW